MEKRADEEYEKKLENYENKMAQRESQREQGRKVLGHNPKEPKKEFDVNWQGNSTDPDSRLMTRRYMSHSPVDQNYGSSGKLVPSVSAGQSVHGFDGLNGYSPIG